MRPAEAEGGHAKTVHSRRNSVRIRTHPHTATPARETYRARDFASGAPALAAGMGLPKGGSGTAPGHHRGCLRGRRGRGRHPKSRTQTVQNRTQTVRCRTPRLPARKARQSRVQCVWRRFASDRGNGALDSTLRNVSGMPRPTPASILRAWRTRRPGRSCRAKQGAIGWRGSETFRRPKTLWALAPYKNLALGGSGSTRAALRSRSDKGPRAGTSTVRGMVGQSLKGLGRPAGTGSV